jgi:predicted AAA+ superfamily ATPase
VGKSSLVKLHGQSYRHFVELNVERPEDRQRFKGLPPVKRVLERLALEFNFPIKGDDVLLFIDEIQESPDAIQMLRFFYEEYPNLRVIAAGSLLEFALGEVRSFPVGRVEFYTLHPLSFKEYLEWMDLERFKDALAIIPVSEAAHPLLLAAFHRYTVLGGMPDIIDALARGAEFAELPQLYAGIWEAYRSDIEKYAKSDTQRNVLRHLMQTAAYADDRFSLAGFGESQYSSRVVSEAFSALTRARVLQLIYPTSDVKAPAGPVLRKRPRVQLLDTGLLNHIRGIQSELLDTDDLHSLYRGRIAQHIVTQEIIALHPEAGWNPLFWIRAKKSSNAEVDLVLSKGVELIPLEVKAGMQGRLRSLHVFVEQANAPIAMRALRNAPSVEDVQTLSGYPYRLVNLPYYAVSEWEAYLEWGKDSENYDL